MTNNNEADENLRLAFEQWNDKHVGNSGYTFLRREKDGYYGLHTSQNWTAFKAGYELLSRDAERLDAIENKNWKGTFFAGTMGKDWRIRKHNSEIIGCGPTFRAAIDDAMSKGD